MRFPVDPRAWPGAVALLFLACAAAFFFKPASLVFLCLLAGHLAFFRDPSRNVPVSEVPVSPADGTVTEVTPVFDSRYLQEEAVKIGIFLSIFVAHVNRAPAAGRVGYLRYEPGKFLNALRKESVNKNESNWIGIEQAGRRVLVRQIAGAIARRIHGDVAMGQELKAGEKLGIICYGSRVECFLPKRFFLPSVRPGDRVRAGETVLGRWLT